MFQITRAARSNIVSEIVNSDHMHVLFLERERLNDIFPREQETEATATTAPKITTAATLKPATTEPGVSPKKAQQRLGIARYISCCTFF